jgi:hypothetical protein
MSRNSVFDDPSQPIDGSPDPLNKWVKNLDSADSKPQSRYMKSDCTNGLLSRPGQFVPKDPTAKEMNRHYQQQQQNQQHQQQQQQSQQQQQHPSYRISNANGNGENGPTASKAIANPTSLPPLSLNNYVPSMLVPNSNKNTNHSQAQQQQQGHNPSTSGRPSIPANNNNAAWLQHMILNPINPLQNNPNGISNNAGGNGSSGISHQANTLAQQQQLQGTLHGNNADINYYHQQQVSNELRDSSIGTSSIATSLSQQQQQQQQHQEVLKKSLLASQQVWPSQGQQQQQQQHTLQQGLQLNQLLSMQQQQQFLPLNELTSQLQLPSVRQTQQLQHQQEVATRNINQIAVLPTAVSAQPSAQQQQHHLLLLASMLQQDNANKKGNSVDVSSLSAALASPEGMRLLQSFLLGHQDNKVQQQQQQNNHLPQGGSAGTGPAGSSNLGVGHLSPVSALGMGEDALSNQQHFFHSQQSQQPQLQSQSQQFNGISSPMPLLNHTHPIRAGNTGESPLGANAVNQHFPSPVDGPSAALTRISSPSNQYTVPNLSMLADPASLLVGSKTNADRGFPPSGRSTKNDKNSKGNNKASTANSQFPRVLYYEADDDILGEYQTLLRQQLELFEADSHDVINGTFRQGRTTPIRLGQIGLRCKHCAKTPLSVRTKGSVYCKSELVSVVVFISICTRSIIDESFIDCHACSDTDCMFLSFSGAPIGIILLLCCYYSAGLSFSMSINQ